MSDLNKVFQTGRLGKEVDLRYTPAGKAVAVFEIAVNDGFGDNKKTYWFKVIAWEKLAEACAEYLKKGSKCLVEGKLTNRNYETQDGQKRHVTEIVALSVQFLDDKKTEVKQPKQEPEINLDDLPF